MLQGIKNLWWFKAVIWRWRWWDYGFQMDVIDKMLEKCEEKWGVNTHYLGDEFTKGRIIVLRRKYQKALDSLEGEDEFAKAYGKLLPKLWD